MKIENAPSPSSAAACYAPRIVGLPQHAIDNRPGAGIIQGARRPGVIAWRPLSDNRRGAGGIQGARRPGVIAWRPLSEDRRGAGRIQGARHAMHVPLGGRRRSGVIAWRPLSDNRRGAGGIEGARHAMHVPLGGAVVRASLHGALCRIIVGVQGGLRVQGMPCTCDWGAPSFGRHCMAPFVG